MQQTQMHVPPLTKINKILLITYVGVFLLGKVLAGAGSSDILTFLSLSLPGIKQGLIFQVITYPFVEFGFTAMLFNALLLWFMGSDLESRWGSYFYGKYLLITAVASAIFYLIFSAFLSNAQVPIYGMTGLNLALILAYAVIFSERTMIFMFLFPMKAKYFCLILAGIELYMGLFTSYSHGAWTHLVGMAVAFGYLKYQSLKAQGITLAALKEQRHKSQMKNKLTLIKNEQERSDKADPENPKYWQ